MFGEFPVTVDCPSCKARVTTEVKKKVGLLARLLAGGLCLVSHLVFDLFLLQFLLLLLLLLLLLVFMLLTLILLCSCYCL